jgi:hypothetical protein
MKETFWRNSHLQTHWRNSTHFRGTCISKLIGGTQLTLEELLLEVELVLRKFISG